MKRSKRLGTVQKVMRDRQTEAARVLGSAQGALVLQQRRLQQLVEYQQEYNQRFLEHGSKGLSAQKMADFRSFIDSLAVAIDRQRDILQRHLVDYEEKKRQWMAAHRRTEAMDDLIDIAKRNEEKKEERSAQREEDDRARSGGQEPDITN